MAVGVFALAEADAQMKKPQAALGRVAADKKEFAPHAKSMPLGKLAPHVAQLAGFGLTILTTREYDFSKGSIKPLTFESVAQLGRAVDESGPTGRAGLHATAGDACKVD